MSYFNAGPEEPVLSTRRLPGLRPLANPPIRAGPGRGDLPPYGGGTQRTGPVRSVLCTCVHPVLRALSQM